MISKPIPSFGKVHRYCWPLISRMHTLQLQFKMAKYLWITLCKYHVHKIQQPKRNLVEQENIWYTKKKFGRPKKWEIDWTIGIPKRLTKSTWTPLLWSTDFFFLVDQIYFWSTKKKLVDQKKWEIDRTIGQPRDWPKVHGRRLKSRSMQGIYGD